MLWVRGREVDVPAVVEGVQFGGPEVAGVFFVGWGTPWGRLVGHVAGFVGIHLGIYVYVYIYFERERERNVQIPNSPNTLLPRPLLKLKQRVRRPNLNAVPHRKRHVVRPLITYHIRIGTRSIRDSQDVVVVRGLVHVRVLARYVVAGKRHFFLF